MLLQGCYGHEFFASLCSAPIFEKLRHMQGYPFPDQAKSPGWQAAFQQGRAIDCQACPILTVLSMEMRRRVIRPVHPDDDAVEGADPRHEPEDMSRVRIVELWWTRGDSNPWPRECDSRALPTELRAHAIWGKASMPLTAEQPGRVRWFLYSRRWLSCSRTSAFRKASTQPASRRGRRSPRPTAGRSSISD